MIKPWADIDLRIFAYQYKKEVLLDALKFMEGFHKGRMRKDGRGYSTHPEKVCQILIYCGVRDTETLIAALFHDVPEEEGIQTLKVIKKCFGFGVCEIVSLLTRRKQESYSEYIKRLNTDVRAMKIKTADQLHNLRNRAERIGKEDFFSVEKVKSQIEKAYSVCLVLEEAMEKYPEDKELKCLREYLIEAIALAAKAVTNY